MKLFRIISLMLAIVCTPLAMIAESDGVPYEMAKSRKENISNINYDLTFEIPQLRSQAIKGICEISFDLKECADIPIDYAAIPQNSNITLSVNGRKFYTQLLDEHIVIPSNLVATGRNIVEIPFTSDDSSLNRHDDYLYTLFVPANARKAFPCFDQPDLKATFTLTLSTPEGWESVSNAPLEHSVDNQGITVYKFQKSKPLPTYLFSFVAGKFNKTIENKDGMQMTAYYRETNPEKLAQLSEVFDIAAQSIRWLEKYTGIPYPFEKYDFVVIPGYQFGGMEHPGAIQFNDTRIFLPANPTPDEELVRLNLIAHETSHMWFGDLVTMSWFDDVWTKEIFANFMADKISREYFPDYNHDIAFARSHYDAAYSVDRTQGAHPIQQPLDNLKNAGLLYGNIIYHKAPIMMRKLEEHIGKDNLQNAVKVYLKEYSYSNATWDDLINIIAENAPGGDIDNFDRVWVKEAGMPEITVSIADGKLQYSQSAATGSKDNTNLWMQNLKIGLLNDTGDVIDEVEMQITDKRGATDLLTDAPSVVAIPNIDALCYGTFPLSDKQISALKSATSTLTKDEQRLATAMLIFENCSEYTSITKEDAFELLKTMLASESNKLVGLSITDYLIAISNLASTEEQTAFDNYLFEIAQNSNSPAVRAKILKYLCANTCSADVLSALKKVWENHSETLLSERDYMTLSYRLAMFYPDKCQEILTTERNQLSNSDIIAEFDYVSRGCTPDAALREKIFKSLIDPRNRVNEPWARDLLRLLCDKTREDISRSYIEDALDNLQYIQKTSDIFFPSTWLASILGKCRTAESRSAVESWLKDNEQLNDALKRKILENLYYIR